MSFADLYVVGEELGKGTFATVFKAFQKSSRNTMAAKILDRTKMSTEVEHFTRRELAIVKQLDGHPCFVKIYDIFEEKTRFVVVMELCEGGPLFSSLSRKVGLEPIESDKILKKCYQLMYDEHEAREVITAMLTGIKHFHDLGIVHRLLAPTLSRYFAS